MLSSYHIFYIVYLSYLFLRTSMYILHNYRPHHSFCFHCYNILALLFTFLLLFFFFFFFQAEDGIRDLTVTGVQTCALPIFMLSTSPVRPRPLLSPRAQTGRRCWGFSWVPSGGPLVRLLPRSCSRSEERSCRERV